MSEELERQLFMDRLIFGTSFKRIDENGEVTRVPPEEVFKSPREE